jgi:hypothetical protein
MPFSVAIISVLAVLIVIILASEDGIIRNEQSKHPWICENVDDDKKNPDKHGPRETFDFSNEERNVVVDVIIGEIGDYATETIVTQGTAIIDKGKSWAEEQVVALVVCGTVIFVALLVMAASIIGYKSYKRSMYSKMKKVLRDQNTSSYNLVIG